MHVEAFPGNKKRHWRMAKIFTVSNAWFAHLKLSKICRLPLAQIPRKGVWTLNDKAANALDNLIAVVPTDAPPRCLRQ